MQSLIYNKIELYYILSKQNVVTLYNKIVAKLFGFQELKVFMNNMLFSVTIRYMLYCWLTYFINFIKFIRSYTDINTTHLHVIKLFPDNRNAIILNQPVIQFKHLNQALKDAENDNKMISVSVLKFELVNDNSFCLKSLVTKYKDTNTNYQNTIENILLFNDVFHDKDTVLNVKLMRNKKMVNINVGFNSVKDKHLNHILYELV